MAKAKRNLVRRRLLAAAGLVLLALVGWGWWEAGEWRPSRVRFPVQGAQVGAADDAVNFSALKVAGADFVYLDATLASGARDPAFEDNLAQAREAGLQVGAVHRYALCRDAGAQAGAFVTEVPRDAKLLPPAVELDLDPVNCPAPPAAEALQSELTTFLNQLERHTGKAAILKLSKAFEARYRLAGMIDRNLWVEGSYLAPGYAGRPWVMWTANARLRSPAANGRLRWVVVRP